MSPAEQKTMIARAYPTLSIVRQCEMLQLSRSAYPFFGSRQIRAYLRRDGIVVGRHRVRRLMGLMGLSALYKRPRTSQPHPAYRVYPDLLKGMAIDRPNQV